MYGQKDDEEAVRRGNRGGDNAEGGSLHKRHRGIFRAIDKVEFAATKANENPLTANQL